MTRFFVGLHHPCDAWHFQNCFISVNRLRNRKGPFEVKKWVMDSGAFTELTRHKGYRWPPSEYAAQIRKWKDNGTLEAAVTQDYMCEPYVLGITGKTVKQHQQLTIYRYDAIARCGTDGVYLMPVLQGYQPSEYLEHLGMYGDRIKRGMWVGVGSICKRNGNPEQIAEVLMTIKNARPDLRLHGFGIKTTALSHRCIVDLLTTADSMAWSFAARREGRSKAANDWREAMEFVKRIEAQIWMTLK